MDWTELKRTVWTVIAGTILAGMLYGGVHAARSTLKNAPQTVYASQVIVNTQHYSRSSAADAGTMALFGIGLFGVAALIRWRLRT